jgi:hypothetical protein
LKPDLAEIGVATQRCSIQTTAKVVSLNWMSGIGAHFEKVRPVVGNLFRADCLSTEIDPS